jgi:hypothetical protein
MVFQKEYTSCTLGVDVIRLTGPMYADSQKQAAQDSIIVI